MEHTFESVLEEVSKLQYSEDSFLDLISCIDKAIQISEAINPDRRTNHCLNNLVQTKQRERDSMMEKDIPDSEREQRFKEALSNFKTDLHMFCIKQS
jgi:hypothetical protein